MVVDVVMIVTQTGGALLERQDLLLQRGELEHPLRVVLHQEPSQSVPAAAHPHHHVFSMKHSDEDGLVSQSVATLGQVLDGHSVSAITRRFVHTSFLRLVQASMLATHTEGFHSWRRFFS